MIIYYEFVSICIFARGKSIIISVAVLDLLLSFSYIYLIKLCFVQDHHKDST